MLSFAALPPQCCVTLQVRPSAANDYPTPVCSDAQSELASSSHAQITPDPKTLADRARRGLDARTNPGLAAVSLAYAAKSRVRVGG